MRHRLQVWGIGRGSEFVVLGFGSGNRYPV